MIDTLKGSSLWAVVLIVLGVLGAATYLASQAILSGSDWLVLGTAVLASVGIVTGAHVAAQATSAALNMPAPGPAPVPATTQAPEPAPVVTATATPAGVGNQPAPVI